MRVFQEYLKELGNFTKVLKSIELLREIPVLKSLNQKKEGVKKCLRNLKEEVEEVLRFR